MDYIGVYPEHDKTKSLEGYRLAFLDGGELKSKYIIWRKDNVGDEEADEVSLMRSIKPLIEKTNFAWEKNPRGSRLWGVEVWMMPEPKAKA